MPFARRTGIAHPDRFVRRPPKPRPLPSEVRIDRLPDFTSRLHFPVLPCLRCYTASENENVSFRPKPRGYSGVRAAKADSVVVWAEASGMTELLGRLPESLVLLALTYPRIGNDASCPRIGRKGGIPLGLRVPMGGNTLGAIERRSVLGRRRGWRWSRQVYWFWPGAAALPARVAGELERGFLVSVCAG